MLSVGIVLNIDTQIVLKFKDFITKSESMCMYLVLRNDNGVKQKFIANCDSNLKTVNFVVNTDFFGLLKCYLLVNDTKVISSVIYFNSYPPDFDRVFIEFEGYYCV